MARYTVGFVWAALLYLIVGMTMGMAMALEPELAWRLRTAHAHVNLLGWVSMFIFGVAYHVLPRFSGRPLPSPWLADFHLVAANVSLIGMAITLVIQGPGPLFALFGALQMLGGLAFVYNVGRTMVATARAATETSR